MTTKVISMYRKSDQKTINLVGVCHVGSKSYYNKIQNILDESSLYGPVFFEGVTGLSNNNLSKLYRLIAEALNLHMQKDVIIYRDNWVKVDLDNSIIKRVKNRDISEVPDDFIKELEALRGENGLNRSVIVKAFAFLFPRFFLTSKVDIIEFRNFKVLIDTINILNNENFVTIFYDNGHLKHFVKILKRCGFNPTGIQKLKPNKD